MIDTLQFYKQVFDWYRVCGIDMGLSDAPRNHYVTAAPIKSSFKPKIIQISQPPVVSTTILPTAYEHIAEKQINSTPKAEMPIAIDAEITSQSASRGQILMINSSEHPALGCSTLEELRYVMEHSAGCDLIKAATHTVFSGGNPDAHIMLIGEAPGVDEDRIGQPFVGQSGQLLDTILETIGINRDSVYISNIIPWRPPGNRPPTTTEINYCLPFIERHIDLVSPKILILLGGVAVKALLGRGDGILKLRGQIFEHITKSGKKIAAMPTLHPSYIMRSPSQKALVWKDMLILKAWLLKNC